MSHERVSVTEGGWVKSRQLDKADSPACPVLLIFLCDILSMLTYTYRIYSHISLSHI